MNRINLLFIALFAPASVCAAVMKRIRPSDLDSALQVTDKAVKP